MLANHSMDSSTPDAVVTLQGLMDDDALLAGKVRIADNGGADLLYWTGAPGQRAAAIERMQAITTDVPGVLAAHKRTEPWLRLGPEAGDVLVFCRAGWRFTEPDPSANPIPGNHGHPATRQIPFFVSGGHPVVPRRTASPAHARTIDVAPTVARFFDAGRPRGGWDGHARI